MMSCLLNSFQLTCSLCDIHLTFLMQPVTLFPMTSGYCTGVLIKLIDVTPHFLMTILGFFVGYQVNVLNLCFLRKHQAIAKISSKYVLSEKVYDAIVFFFMTYTFTYVIPFYLAHLTKEEEYQIIERVNLQNHLQLTITISELPQTPPQIRKAF